MGGFAGGVEDLHDDEVGVECGLVAVGLYLPVEDGGEVIERVCALLGEGRCGGGGFGLLAVVAGAQVVGGDGDGVAVDAVDLHVLAGEAPVPGGHEDGLGAGVAEDDRGIVVDVRVDVGLVGLGNGGDAQGGGAVLDEGHEVGAVAAEVEEGAGAVLDGVGEPGEPLGADADLFRAFVAVVDDDFADVAELALLYFGEDLAIAGVPGGFVVDEDVDVMLAGGGADGEGVGEGCGEGLFDHGGNAVTCGGFDDFAMVLDGGVDEDGVGVLGVEHAVGIGVEQLGIEVVFGGVAPGEGGIGLDDGDELGAGVIGESAKEALHMAVDEADDGDADGGSGGDGGSEGDGEEAEEEGGEAKTESREHGES